MNTKSHWFGLFRYNYLQVLCMWQQTLVRNSSICTLDQICMLMFYAQKGPHSFWYLFEIRNKKSQFCEVSILTENLRPNPIKIKIKRFSFFLDFLPFNVSCNNKILLKSVCRSVCLSPFTPGGALEKYSCARLPRCVIFSSNKNYPHCFPFPSLRNQGKTVSHEQGYTLSDQAFHTLRPSCALQRSSALFVLIMGFTVFVWVQHFPDNVPWIWADFQKAFQAPPTF